MKRTRFYIIGGVLGSFFILGVFYGVINSYYARAAVLAREIASNSQVYADDSLTLQQERTHCAVASAIEKELTKLQATNATLREQLQLMSLSSKK